MENYERKCVICSSEFLTRFQKQVYCSYDCYCEAAKSRSASYYLTLKKARTPISKICPTCHEPFETLKMRVKYCSEPCAREAKLEKCREYSAKLRVEYQIQHPKSFMAECSLCGEEYDYRTKQGKYCDKCAPLARKISRGWGPLDVKKDLQEADAALASKEVVHTNGKIRCFVCDGPAVSPDTPCEKCNAI